MICYNPPEQLFHLENSIISIDWGLNGDHAVKVTIRKDPETGGFIIDNVEVVDEARNKNTDYNEEKFKPMN